MATQRFKPARRHHLTIQSLGTEQGGLPSTCTEGVHLSKVGWEPRNARNARAQLALRPKTPVLGLAASLCSPRPARGWLAGWGFAGSDWGWEVCFVT